MRFSTFLSTLVLLVAPVASQNDTLLGLLLQQLEDAGLTSLANATAVANSSSLGQSLLAQLGSGPQTIFAPNNDACAFLFIFIHFGSRH